MQKSVRAGLTSLALVLVMWTSTAVAQSDPDATWQRTASALAAYWFETYNAGAIDLLVQMYAEDVDVRHLSGEVVTGRDLHRGALQGFMDNGITFEPVGGVSGLAPVASGLLGTDGAWARWTFQGLDAEGTVVVVGESIYLYRRVEGGWEIVSQSNYPTPTPME